MAAVLLLSLCTAQQSFAGTAVPLVHDHGGQNAGTDVDPLAVAARIALLLGTAVVAGIGLFRGSVTDVTTRLRTLAWAGAALAVAALLVSIVWLNVNVMVGVLQLALTAAMPVLLRWQTPALAGGLLLALVLTAESAVGNGGLQFLVDTIGTLAVVIWFGLASIAVAVPDEARKPDSYRPGPMALTISTALVAVGIGQFVFAGIGLDRRMLTSAFGITLLVAVLAPLVVAVLTTLALRDRSESTGPWRAYRIGALGVATAFVAWAMLVAIPRPPELPVPGVPLLATVNLAEESNSLLVSPQRPGRNLVYLPESMDGARVGVGDGELRAATVKAGSQGRWAMVDLPRGRTDLTVDYRGEQTTVEVDAGERAGGPASATGPDGAECASAALGALLADNRATLNECPSDRLSAGDERALGATVRFLKDRKTPAITVSGDDSKRAEQARRVIQKVAAEEGIPLTDQPGKDNALLVVSGWRAAADVLESVKQQQAQRPIYTRGVHLSPWLMNSSLMRTTASSLLPLSFDPREPEALEYAVAVSEAFPGETATLGGYHRWMSGKDQDVDGPVQMYVASQIDVWQLNTRAPAEASVVATHLRAGDRGWLPGGTIIPATGALR